MVSGLAPGSEAVTSSVGKSTLGRSLTGSCIVGDAAEKCDRDHQQNGRYGPAYENFGEVQAFASVITDVGSRARGACADSEFIAQTSQLM